MALLTQQMSMSQPTPAVPVLVPPQAANLQYWFMADGDVYSDAGVTPIADGDGVAQWGNQGTQEDAAQSTAINRPTWHEGGLNGRPYIEADPTVNDQFFENLLGITATASSLAYIPSTIFVVTDAVDTTDFRPIIGGAGVAAGGKVSLYFRTTPGTAIHFTKAGVRQGSVVNPQIIMGTQGRDSTSSGNTNDFWLRQNGVNLLDGGGSGSLTATAISEVEFLRISASTMKFKGRIYEMLRWNATTLTLTELLEVEAYLSEKYGIPI